MSQRQESRCPTCYGSPRQGLIPLAGDDWLTCPDCDGTTVFVCYEQRITPPRHFLMPDLKGRT